METSDATSSWQGYNAIGAEEWDHLYLCLHLRVRHWVYTTPVPVWRGQESSVVEDIVQNTVVRVLQYMQRAARGEVGPIMSIQHLADVIAYHCYTDMWRHDRRLLPIVQESSESEAELDIVTFNNLLDLAIDNVHQESLFAQVARWVVSFPEKQCNAILIDLANRMHFDRFSLTPLQQAFANVGISLQEYQQALPQEAEARARRAAHLRLAYKRLAQLAYL